MANVLLCDANETESQAIITYLSDLGHSVFHITDFTTFTHKLPMFNVFTQSTTPGLPPEAPHSTRIDVAIVAENFGAEADMQTATYATLWALDSFKPEIRLGYIYRERPTKFIDFCFQIEDLTVNPRWLQQTVEKGWTGDSERFFRRLGTTCEAPPVVDRRRFRFSTETE